MASHDYFKKVDELGSYVQTDGILLLKGYEFTVLPEREGFVSEPDFIPLVWVTKNKDGLADRSMEEDAMGYHGHGGASVQGYGRVMSSPDLDLLRSPQKTARGGSQLAAAFSAQPMSTPYGMGIVHLPDAGATEAGGSVVLVAATTVVTTMGAQPTSSPCDAQVGDLGDVEMQLMPVLKPPPPISAKGDQPTWWVVCTDLGIDEVEERAVGDDLGMGVMDEVTARSEACCAEAFGAGGEGEDGGLSGFSGEESRKAAGTVDSRPCGFPFLGRARYWRRAAEEAASAHWTPSCGGAKDPKQDCTQWMDKKFREKVTEHMNYLTDKVDSLEEKVGNLKGELKELHRHH
ncbi:hypothetical protein ZWY2020_045050 [Hordeum vulgare]|nr:hypothetical protein ZWY2020_045050 [Hordeum vulgare]